MDLGLGTSDSVTYEFRAVILSGFGNELLPLTSEHGDDPCPKALLPIANKPMLHYTLSWLEQSGIRDVLLICPASHRPAISHYIHSDSSPSPSLRVDLQAYDETQDLSTGTCALLRHFSSRILDDFILLPCDFIPPPSLSLAPLLNKFRTDIVADGCIATACWFETQYLEKGTVVDEWGHVASPVPIVWEESTGTLLHVDTPDDLDNNAEDIELRLALLSQHPRTKLSASLQDSHVYVCRRSILDALHEKPHFVSFREEFLPWLCKLQYQRTKRVKYAHVLSPMANTLPQSLALMHSTLHSHRNAISKHSTLSGFSTFRGGKDVQASVPTSPTGPVDDPVEPASMRIGVIIHRSATGLAARANNIHNFMELNRRFLADTSFSLPTDPKSRALIDQKAQISTDSILGNFTKVDERTTIKRSVIGSHCIIGKMVKIVGCVLLDHCVVEDKAKVDGCILGKNTRVGVKAELTRCVTQAGYAVVTGESFKNEKLEVSDWTAGAGDDLEEESDEDSGGEE